MRARKDLYDRDFYAWTEEQARYLRHNKLNMLDLENLIEEVESMGRMEKMELSSRLEVLLMHLLKWKYQSEMQSKSWKRTIIEQRFRIHDVLKDNPSLKPKLKDHLTDAYFHARILAHEETTVFLENIPVVCEWTIKQILDDEFFPE